MKMSYVACLLLFVPLITNISQTPTTLNYQAAARSIDGQVLRNETLEVRISILRGHIDSKLIWQEIHSATTNELGLLSLEIGSESKTGGDADNFSSINWGEGAHFLKIEIDDGGWSWLGTTQMLAVPYALHAGVADSISQVSWDNLVNTPNSLEGYELDYVETRVAYLELAISTLTPGLTLCNGAFVDLQTDVENCGDCGIVCTSDQICINGVCTDLCPDGTVRCGDECVDVNSDVANCGRCNVVCPVGETCVDGVCTLVCPDGTIKCGNECVDLQSTQISCLSSVNLGQVCGDGSSGFLCLDSPENSLPTVSGIGEKWFRLLVEECSNCPSDLNVRFQLYVPSGIDYDLEVYSSCSTTTPLKKSESSGSGIEEIIVSENDNTGSDDDFELYVKVVYFTGASCENWNLTTQAGNW